MSLTEETIQILPALRRYIEELEETGLDWIPLDACVTGSTAAALPQTPSAEDLDAIRSELGDCHRCVLGETRTNLVFGVGNPKARVVFVGEAPGRDEDLKGEPFVGEAGQLLNKIIQAMGFRRDEVYICNVLKCRPPKNRDPLPEEVAACGSFMLRQVQAIAPAAVVALGTFAAQTLLGSREPISRLRGRFHDYYGIPLMPTFHPAFLLRNQNMKRQVWEDMQQVMNLLGKELPRPAGQGG